MADNIKIYKTVLTPDKNAVVDDLASYLGTLTETYSNELQHIKLDLDINIKLDLAQSYVGTSIGNYAVITQDDKDYYFFILKANWISKQCVQLELSMDTVNTFRNDFVWTDKTSVTREHKDRLKFLSYVPGQEDTMSFSDRDADWFEPYGPDLWSLKQTYYLPELQSFRFVTVSNLQLTSQYGEIFDSHYSWNQEEYKLTLEVIVRYEEEPEEVYGNFKIAASGSTMTTRVIDKHSEGITGVLFHKPENDITILQNDDNLKWYLIYKNENDPSPDDLTNPVDCFLCADRDLQVKGIGYTSWDPTDLDDGKKYVFLYQTNPHTTFYFSKDGTKYDAIQIDDKPRNIYLSKVGGKIKLSWGIAGTTKFSKLGITDVTNIIDIRISNGVGYYEYTGSITGNTFIQEIRNHGTFRSIEDQTVNTLNSIESVDRADAKLIKIIELPYCPTSWNGERIGNGEWELDGTTGLLKLSNLNVKFKDTFKFYWNPLNELIVGDINPEMEVNRNDLYESKLWHSDYYQQKIVYDAFNFVYQLENIKDNYWLTTADMEIDFVTTSTINSKFLFKFPQYQLNYSTQDYSDVCIVDRNNELPLYNSEYINYIKTGYNYDRDSKDRQTAFSWIATGLQLAGGLAGVVFGEGVGKAVGISLLTTTFASIASNINGTISRDADFAQKQQQAANQATSVMGSTDIDLLNAYSDNKAKVCVYSVSPELREQLADLFYYCGYADNTQHTPNITSRKWFNYIQCTPEFEEENTNMYNHYLEDIKARYQVGVTVYHNVDDSWDFEQVKENWETSLYE